MASVADPELHDAAINAVAIASVAYHTDPTDDELRAFQHIVATALTHGISVREVADAAGLRCEQLADLIERGTL